MESLLEQLEKMKDEKHKLEQEMKGLRFINKSYKEKMMQQDIALEKCFKVIDIIKKIFGIKMLELVSFQNGKYAIAFKTDDWCDYVYYITKEEYDLLEEVLIDGNSI